MEIEKPKPPEHGPVMPALELDRQMKTWREEKEDLARNLPKILREFDHNFHEKLPIVGDNFLKSGMQKVRSTQLAAHLSLELENPLIAGAHVTAFLQKQGYEPIIEFDKIYFDVELWANPKPEPLYPFGGATLAVQWRKKFNSVFHAGLFENEPDASAEWLVKLLTPYFRRARSQAVFLSTKYFLRVNKIMRLVDHLFEAELLRFFDNQKLLQRNILWERQWELSSLKTQLEIEDWLRLFPSPILPTEIPNDTRTPELLREFAVSALVRWALFQIYPLFKSEYETHAYRSIHDIMALLELFGLSEGFTKDEFASEIHRIDIPYKYENGEVHFDLSQLACEDNLKRILEVPNETCL